MKYQSTEEIVLGDIVELELHDGSHEAKVIMIGKSGASISLDGFTAKWAIESGHIGEDKIMVEFLNKCPFHHDDPKFAPVSNTLTLTPDGVVFKKRA